MAVVRWYNDAMARGDNAMTMVLWYNGDEAMLYRAIVIVS